MRLLKCRVVHHTSLSGGSPWTKGGHGDAPELLICNTKFLNIVILMEYVQCGYQDGIGGDNFCMGTIIIGPYL